MSYAKQMLDSYSRTFNVDNGLLAATIDALNDCAQACTADVDADLGEQDVSEMVKCIRLCMECAQRSRSRCWKRARSHARAAVTSASGMPRCTSTAGSAERPAVAASKPAGSSWTP